MNAIPDFIYNNEPLLIILGALTIILVCIVIVIWPKIRIEATVRWRKLTQRIRRTPLVSGDIITFESVVNEPVNLSNRQRIESLRDEILRSGFDNNLEAERFLEASYVFRRKYYSK